MRCQNGKMAKLWNKRKMPPDVSNYSRFMLENSSALFSCDLSRWRYVRSIDKRTNHILLDKSNRFSCMCARWLLLSLAVPSVRFVYSRNKQKKNTHTNNNNKWKNSNQIFDTKLKTKKCGENPPKNCSVCHLSWAFHFITLQRSSDIVCFLFRTNLSFHGIFWHRRWSSAAKGYIWVSYRQMRRQLVNSRQCGRYSERQRAFELREREYGDE